MIRVSLPVAQRRVEAGAAVGVTGRTGLVDQHEQRISVAIDPQFHQTLDMARGRALLPELLARARPVGDAPGLEGPRHRGRIHEGQHQHLARRVILRDRRDQAVRVIGQAGRIEGIASLLCKRGRAAYLMGERAAWKAKMSDGDLIKLYSGRILELAADIPHLGRLTAPNGSAKRRSPLCGSTVTVDVRLTDGRISDFAQDVKPAHWDRPRPRWWGGRSSAARRPRSSGRATSFGHAERRRSDTCGTLRRLEVLSPARDYKNRHARSCFRSRRRPRRWRRPARRRAPEKNRRASGGWRRSGMSGTGWRVLGEPPWRRTRPGTPAVFGEKTGARRQTAGNQA